MSNKDILTTSNQKNQPELSVVVLGYRAGLLLKAFILELVTYFKKTKLIIK